MRLANKIAIVTGAASGIGRATARRFGAEGASVVAVTDRRVELGEETASMIRAAGGTAAFVQGDVGIAGDVERFVAATVRLYGGVDILVNNAAWARSVKATELSEEDWDRTLAVTLKSVYFGAKYAIPEMIKRGGGVILNISSVNGIISNPGFSAYSAAKGGVEILTKNLAIDYGLQGIRVVSIAPGLVENEGAVRWLTSDPDEMRAARDPYLVGRWGQPIDIANAALFLASDEASFITGTTLVVDGGLTCQSPEATGRPSFRKRWRSDVVAVRDKVAD
jgi:NAD(P)-dependent dehydrogenase (short-subunit alcohol dehydrogenase family)